MSTEVWRHFAAHHGVITHAEAAALGVTRSRIRTLVKNEEWIRVGPAVYRSAATEFVWEARARAEVMTAGGLLSHRAAAVIWNIDGWNPGVIDVTVRRAKGRRPRRGSMIHESTQFDLAAPTIRNGLPVTGLARTVLDVAGVVGPKRLEWTVDAVLRQQLLDWPDLLEVLIRHSRKGRNGCGKLRQLLEVRYGDSVLPDSRWNRMFCQLLLDAGLPEPRLEYEVHDGTSLLGRVDLAYPQQRLAIELDSLRWHLNRSSFERDPRRKNRLMLAGWMVLTFTWDDFKNRPYNVIKTVLEALESQSGALAVDA